MTDDNCLEDSLQIVVVRHQKIGLRTFTSKLPASKLYVATDRWPGLAGQKRPVQGSSSGGALVSTSATGVIPHRVARRTVAVPAVGAAFD